jgi:hypothetical protein
MHHGSQDWLGACPSAYFCVCVPVFVRLTVQTTVSFDSSEEKQERIRRLEALTTTVAIGMRVCGMRVSCCVCAHAHTKAKTLHNGEYANKDKSFGKKLKAEEMQDALRFYFSDGTRVRHDVITLLLPKLHDLLDFFENDNQHTFISSSLLFVYDGDAASVRADVKMIDFAHVFKNEAGSKDHGYITGLKNLINYLKAIHGDQ